MRLLLLLCLLPFSALAQADKEYPFRFQLGGAAGTPIAQPKNTVSDAVVGRAAAGAGAAGIFMYRVKPKVFVGLAVNFLSFKLDEETAKAGLYKKYSKPGYYTHVNAAMSQFTLVNINLEISYKNRTPVVEIEPFIRTGITTFDYTGDVGELSTKQQNSNLRETIILSGIKGTFVSPGISAGVRFFRKLNKKGGIAASVHYSYSNHRLTINEKTSVNLTERYTSESFTLRVPIHAIQYELGLQFRIYK